MKKNGLKMLAISLVAGVALIGAPVSMAADAEGAPVKQLSCKQEAEKAGIKDKVEFKKYVKKCAKERKVAKKKVEESSK